MNRVPYRRVTPPRGGVSSQIEFTRSPEKKTIGETIIVQAIISGMLLAVVLVVCLVDIGPLVSLRGRLGQVLDGANTVEEFAADINRLRENWSETPQVPPTPQIEQPERYERTEQIEQPEPEEIPPFLYIPSIPLTAQEEPINPQIPGPSMGPGLWD